MNQEMNEVKIKICTRCKVKKKMSEFYKKSNGHFKSECKKCTLKYLLKYYKQHPEKADIRRMRKSSIHAGLEPTKVETMLKNHNRLCEICGKKEIKGRRLSVDHNHTNGEFRGFLCLRCNNGLGCFHDDIKLFKKAIQYLGEE